MWPESWVDPVQGRQAVWAGPSRVAGGTAEQLYRELHRGRRTSPHLVDLRAVRQHLLMLLNRAPFLLISGVLCGRSGPTKELLVQFKPLLEKYKISAWLNGHEHCNQHIVEHGIHYFTSGTAENNDPSTNHSDFNKKFNTTAAL